MDFEFRILDFIQEYLSSPIMDRIMIFFTMLGDAGALWIAVALYMIISKKHRRTGIALSIALLVSSVLGNLILKPVFARPRPFITKEGMELLINAPGDFSFPSGHTLASFVSATVLIMREKKIGLCFLLPAVLISFSRMYLYVHFPTDILAGILLGVLMGILSVKVTDRLFEKNIN